MIKVDSTPILDRVDKNGTKYWHSNACRKCGGEGYLAGYEHIEGGVCFMCGGSGYHPHTWKELTPEYAAKLAERRLAKAKAKAPERNAKFLRSQGFSEDGRAWFPAGNTFEIKDQLKAAGARYNDLLGWHFDHPVSEFTCFEVSIDDLTYITYDGSYDYIAQAEITAYLRDLREKHAPKTTSEYIANVGDRIQITAKYVRCHTYETHFTYRGETNYIHKFTDESGNTVVWKTSSFQDFEPGEMYTIKGTVKEHSEYKGDKQTVLTRCKVI